MLLLRATTSVPEGDITLRPLSREATAAFGSPTEIECLSSKLISVQ